MRGVIIIWLLLPLLITAHDLIFQKATYTVPISQKVYHQNNNNNNNNKINSKDTNQFRFIEKSKSNTYQQQRQQQQQQPSHISELNSPPEIPTKSIPLPKNYHYNQQNKNNMASSSRSFRFKTIRNSDTYNNRGNRMMMIKDMKNNYMNRNNQNQNYHNYANSNNRNQGMIQHNFNGNTFRFASSSNINHHNKHLHQGKKANINNEHQHIIEHDKPSYHPLRAGQIVSDIHQIPVFKAGTAYVPDEKFRKKEVIDIHKVLHKEPKSAGGNLAKKLQEEHILSPKYLRKILKPMRFLSLAKRPHGGNTMLFLKKMGIRTRKRKRRKKCHHNYSCFRWRKKHERPRIRKHRHHSKAHHLRQKKKWGLTSRKRRKKHDMSKLVFDGI